MAEEINSDSVKLITYKHSVIYVAAVTSVWNSLLESVSTSQLLLVFRSRLKTGLFAGSYSLL